MVVDVISIVFISIIILFVLLGVYRGFIKSVISLIRTFCAFIISIFISKPIASLLLKTEMGSNLSNNFIEHFSNKGGIFITSISETNKKDVIDLALNNINLPNKIHELLSKMIVSVMPNIQEECSVAEAIGPTIAYYIFLVISFIICFIILFIIITIIGKFLNILAQIPFVGFFNRLLGGIVNGFIGVAIVCLISYIFTMIVPLDNSFSVWLSETMRLDNKDVFTLSKYFYENNFLVNIIAFLQGLLFK